MSTTAGPHPLSLSDMVDYTCGDLEAAREASFEAHMLSCDACARELEAVFQLAAAIRSAVAEGHAAAPVSDAFVRQARARGETVREYRVEPGETVACTAAPDDRFVVIRLGGPLEGVLELGIDIHVENLETREQMERRADGVPVDTQTGEAVLLFPGRTARGYPRSRWTMHVAGRGTGGPFRLGPYVLDHTPWNESGQS